MTHQLYVRVVQYCISVCGSLDCLRGIFLQFWEMNTFTHDLFLLYCTVFHYNASCITVFSNTFVLLLCCCIFSWITVGRKNYLIILLIAYLPWFKCSVMLLSCSENFSLFNFQTMIDCCVLHLLYSIILEHRSQERHLSSDCVTAWRKYVLLREPLSIQTNLLENVCELWIDLLWWMPPMFSTILLCTLWNAILAR